MEETRQFDNINQRVIDDLRVKLNKGSRLSVAAASFSIYAFEALRKELEQVESFNFIFTSPTFYTDQSKKQKREFYIPKQNRELNLYGTEFEIRLRNEMSQRAIARECANWVREKCHFKTNITNGVMNGFLNVENSDGQYTYMPFNEFTTTELGCEKGNNLCQSMLCLPAPMSYQFLQNFYSLWNDHERIKDVTDAIVDNIETLYKENPPEFIYFVTLYNIFNEFLEDISEDVLPNEATGFKTSQIWGKLYNFQKDAALAIINKLEKYNGCILADSVGLGKTFTALAVIKYYENRNKNVLVLCPKKLNDNWITYRSNYVNNPIAKDRLRYDILFHTDLARKGGETNGLKLDHINWGNYDLVVIDESHNFRNGSKTTVDDEENTKGNRYYELMEKVIKSGVKTKVLMLSATPVNNRFNDLKNQLQLAYEGDSSRLDNQLETTTSIDSIFRQAQKAYNLWSKRTPEERTTQALLDSLSFDFFTVLDAVTIARSRRHIEQYYDTTEIGRFPDRARPISRRPSLTDLGTAINYNEIYQIVSLLNLAIYTPSDFILPSRLSFYADDKDEGSEAQLSMAGREKGIRRLMSINLLKRLESSVNSFRLTLQRLRNNIDETLQMIAAHSEEIEVTEVRGIDLDLDDQETDTIVGRKTKVRLEDLDTIQWKYYLEADKENLDLLLLMLQDISPEHDSKLNQLKEDLRNKFEHPINGDNKKVLIFTAFSDTAQYLYDNLATHIKEHYGLNVAMVTGDVEARSTLKLPAREKLDFNKVLTLFSPVSKEREAIYPKLKENIDVLIATDCISEGQNLQDCDYLLNYDIHWNPVRIIQRFGRIDRIGSRNQIIQLVNYWPDMTLDEYIDLKARVEARMKVSVMTSTGDDNLLSPEEKGDLQYRKAQLKRLQEEVVDLEDMDTGINIMDLGLNEFRLDLLDYVKRNGDMDKVPYGLHAVVAHSSLTPGVLFVLKNRNNAINIDKKNRLHPFYMVYVDMDGHTLIDHLKPKDLLDRMRKMCKGKSEPDKEICRLFNKETRDGQQMKTYSKLLGDAVQGIVSVKERSDLDSFLSGIQGSLFKEQKGLDDFELVTFLVIK
ncbi:MAG: DEAD/DEAH box helicase family protein [Bacteroidales bacterium]|nr:DEAD/DEAH box helicase family protein [Bacteroidales bacterium]